MLRVQSACALLVMALVFASCGGSGGRAGSIGDEEAIKKMVVASTVQTGPDTCLRFSTLHFLERVAHLEGEAAIEACEEAALDPIVEQPTSVEVSRIEVAGGSATVLVAFEGSVFDGQNVRYALIERDENWKFDDMLGFVSFDSENLVLRIGRELMLRAESPEEAETGACIVGLMDGLSEEAVEELILGSTFEPLYELADRCADASSAI